MGYIKFKLRNNTFLSAIICFYRQYFQITRRKFGYIDQTAFFRQPLLIKGTKNVYLYENTFIQANTVILSTLAKFIMKKNSGAAEGLTVVTGNHQSFPGVWFRFITDSKKNKKMDKDVIVEEDVWIGARVTLLAGTIVGRGAEIGAGSVCRGKIPPYAIVVGNPAKVVGYRFTPEEVIEHEKALYPEEERLSLKKLEKNYEKYFENREKIVESLRLY